MLKRSRAAFVALGSFVVSSAAFAQDSYSDPAGSGVFVSAVNWLQGTLLGTVATVVAVIAVATVGFMMLTGRAGMALKPAYFATGQAEPHGMAATMASNGRKPGFSLSLGWPRARQRRVPAAFLPS